MTSRLRPLTRRRRPSRTTAPAAMALACLIGTLATAGPAAADPGHDNPDPGDVTTYEGPLALMGPDEVVAHRYGRWAQVNLRVRGVPGAGDLEVVSTRAADRPYHGPITTSWTLADRSGTFEPGLQQDFTGLPGLLRTTYRDRRGTVVRRTSDVGCLNGGGVRIQPGGEARNRYPGSCPYNAYTLGSVQGIQQGWTGNLSGWGRGVRLPVGRYTATVRVGQPYAAAWDLDPAASHVEVDVTVANPGRTKGEVWRRGAAATSAPTASAAPPATPAAREPSARTDDAVPPGTPMPDLRSLPAFDLSMAGKGNLIRFAANVWNAGDSPLVIDGFRTADEDVMAAYQYFFDSEGDQIDYEPVEDSGFYWHAENHNHWHFADFARYQLLDADRQVVRNSGKVSFCLANTDAVDYTVPGADWRPGNTDLSTSCGRRGSLSVREVLSAGSGDTYAQYRAGQAFGKIDRLPNGTYYVRVAANPHGALIESDLTNNVVDRRIRLMGRGAQRRVVAAKIGVIDENSGFDEFFRGAR